MPRILLFPGPRFVACGKRRGRGTDRRVLDEGLPTGTERRLADRRESGERRQRR